LPKKYLFYTDVQGQRSVYRVKHETKEDMEKYNAKLAEQYPYFIKVQTGEL
jgi:hypothetical protein